MTSYKSHWNFENVEGYDKSVCMLNIVHNIYTNQCDTIAFELQLNYQLCLYGLLFSYVKKFAVLHPESRQHIVSTTSIMVHLKVQNGSHNTHINL